MGIKVETHPDESVIIVTLKAPVEMPEDALAATDATVKFQKQQKDMICRITDFSHVELSFSDVMEEMSSDRVLRDPNIQSILVGNDEMAQLTADSFRQEQYGSVDVKLVPTRKAALKQAQQLLQDA